MTGLDLEPFLRLLRADVDAWATLALAAVLLALIAWKGWASRRVLRSCLVLSVLAHVGLAIVGRDELSQLMAPGGALGTTAGGDGIREIQVSSAGPSGEGGLRPSGDPRGVAGAAGAFGAEPDLAALSLPPPADPPLLPPRPVVAEVDAIGPPDIGRFEPPPLDSAAPTPVPDVPSAIEDRPTPIVPEPTPVAAPVGGDLAEVAAARGDRDADAQATLPLPEPGRLAARPDDRGRQDVPDPGPRIDPVGPAVAPALMPDPARFRPDPAPDRGVVDVGPAASPSEPDAGVVPAPRPADRGGEPPPLGLPDADLRATTRPSVAANPIGPAPEAIPELASGLDLDRVVPGARPNRPGVGAGLGRRPLLEVPEVYRPRLDPNRSVLARRAGASSASEEAVERALDWLARHQDGDGRWDAGTARYRDGSAARGEDSFTAHCPPGDICPGECYYWEADTALTGLALLAFLGSGYTHTDGKYAQVVGRGVDFLVNAQKPDGDLRGTSKAVGMYCHAMAALALSEAYALSGDPGLRGPVERAVAFLDAAQYPGRMGWRYAPSAEIRREPAESGGGLSYVPHPPVGDTSVLGWVVMVLKSASEVGVPASEAAVGSARDWLVRVADGEDGGLARYQPARPADPVMTAEAWACRQFLGVGGPGPSSREAAAELLRNLPTAESYNAYFWYYATLALYQDGGPAWERWNASVRDTLVSLQRRDGHRAGSWDPDPTRYGTHGGRVYATALATLTLEVYYRYLRLYAPEAGAAVFPAPTPPGDGGVRRAGADAVR